jgi:hypothetical protein
LGLKPRSWIAARTLACVLSLTIVVPLRTRDTVAEDTPADRATSRIPEFFFIA